MTEPNLDEELAAREARRKARRDEADAKFKARKILDLDALEPILDEHGETNISIKEVDFSGDDLPVLYAVKTPNQNAMKKYREECKQRKIDEPLTANMVKAQENLAHLCLVYPSREVFAQLEEKRPGIRSQAGAAAAQLAIGRDENEGKA